MRRVHEAMGTVFTLEIPNLEDEQLMDRLIAQVDSAEQVFSVHLENSEICRIGRNELSLDEASGEAREVLTRCGDLRGATQGWFEHEPRQRSGNPDHPILDPSGFVKGWTADQLALTIRISGYTEFFVDAGGDVLCGESVDDAWQVGLRHPTKEQGVMAVLAITNMAVATTGNYTRGQGEDNVLLSATVLGPELAEADALSSAVFASGEAQPSWWGVDPRYELLTASSDGRLRWTQGFGRYLVQPAPAPAETPQDAE